MPSLINYSTLIDAISPDDVREHGSLTVDEAINAFETFAFRRAISELTDNPGLMQPTITFTNLEQAADFAIWMNTDEKFEIWVPHECIAISGIMDAELIKNCIRAFFDSDYQRLRKLLESD